MTLSVQGHYSGGEEAWTRKASSEVRACLVQAACPVATFCLCYLVQLRLKAGTQGASAPWFRALE